MKEKTKEKAWRQLKWEDRVKLEAWLKAGITNKTQLAEMLGCSRATIYNEIKRGLCEQRTSDYEDIMVYCADYAQEKYEAGLSVRGAKMKIGTDYEYANFLEEKIADEKYSPEAALGEIKLQGKKFKTTVCTRTLYSYIDKGIFLRLSNKELAVKRNKGKRTYNVVRRKKAAPGKTIEDRPESVYERNDFGDWEMDTVVGKRGKGHSLLVLTERMTRKEIIFLLYEHTAEQVVSRLDELERKMGKRKFRKIFRTITVDNGSEFADYEGMMRSYNEKGPPRTQIFYCHPYSSWERGSNETTNKLIRRHIPKGTSFDDKTEADIQKIEDWINNYPRRIFGFHSANDMYEQELAKLA